MRSACKMRLTRPIAAYYTGETVAGVAHIKIIDPQEITGISIALYGEGKVKWEEILPIKKSFIGKYYSTNKEYFRKVIKLRNQGEILAGVYRYNFKFKLPKNVPTSCESRDCQIRYELLLTIERRRIYSTIIKKPLSVVNPFDLNSNPVYKLPIEAEVVYNLCYLLCAKSLICTLRLPQSAYVPGQSVPYSISLNNCPLQHITSYVLDFVKKTVCIAEEPEIKKRGIELILYSTSYQAESDNENFIEGEFQIPPTAPSTEEGDIIHIEYALKILIKLSNCSKKMEFNVPIVIGTIPLVESITTTHLQTTCISQEQLAQLQEKLREEEELQEKQEEQPQHKKQIEEIPQNPSGVEQAVPTTTSTANKTEDIPFINKFIPVGFERSSSLPKPFIDPDTDKVLQIIYYCPFYPVFYAPYPKVLN